MSHVRHETWRDGLTFHDQDMPYVVQHCPKIIYDRERTMRRLLVMTKLIQEGCATVLIVIGIEITLGTFFLTLQPLALKKQENPTNKKVWNSGIWLLVQDWIGWLWNPWRQFINSKFGCIYLWPKEFQSPVHNTIIDDFLNFIGQK